MKLEWTFSAESYLDQLSPEERSKVLHAVQRLATEWDSAGPRLKALSGDQQNLYSLRVGSDLQVVVRRQKEIISVVDVVRRSQVEGLRRLADERHAVSR